ncbi:MAG TPA: NADH-quinone oxidoreductase subunit L, partial [Bacteroidales bacterium]|nr:NADH-quinone oxidoreductase subunit L [Bacteroidales bacterium]
MTNFLYTIWIPLIPMLMFLIIGLGGSKLKARLSGMLGTTAISVVAILSYITAFRYFFSAGQVDGVYQKLIAFN